jgi:hypothetical protein
VENYLCLGAVFLDVINDKFCQLELRELQNKVDALREEKSTLKAQISNAE